MPMTVHVQLADGLDVEQVSQMLAGFPTGCRCFVSVRSGRRTLVWKECPAHPNGPAVPDGMRRR